MSARKKSAPRRPARRAALSLSQRIERLERDLLFKTPPQAPLAGERFIKLDDKGKPTAGDHIALLDRKTGLAWSAGPIGSQEGETWSNAKRISSELRLLGKEDWRLPTIEELLSIVDYSKYDPAVDKTAFKGPFGWTWSSTEYKGSAGFAWVVDLGGGGSYFLGRSFHDRVRAVRSGQQLGLSV